MNDETKSNEATVTSSSERFPRSSELPTQWPKYWAKEKDRYIRQLLIKDIEAATKRPLFVYFAQLDQEITHSDPDDLSEIIGDISDRCADFFIQTPGGNVDATEKIVSVLRKKFDNYRVVVPSWAKSAGTVIALSSEAIVFGINSELGPIDPHWVIQGNRVPCEILAQDPALPQHLRTMAGHAAQRMSQLAQDLLARGMMQSANPQDIQTVISKISSSAGYLSHGAVIDYEEARQLGLSVEFLQPEDDTWKRIWLLYCLYDYDTKARALGKVFEGSRFSIGRPK